MSETSDLKVTPLEQIDLNRPPDPLPDIIGDTIRITGTIPLNDSASTFTPSSFDDYLRKMGLPVSPFRAALEKQKYGTVLEYDRSLAADIAMNQPDQLKGLADMARAKTISDLTKEPMTDILIAGDDYAKQWFYEFNKLDDTFLDAFVKNWKNTDISAEVGNMWSEVKQLRDAGDDEGADALVKEIKFKENGLQQTNYKSKWVIDWVANLAAQSIPYMKWSILSGLQEIGKAYANDPLANVAVGGAAGVAAGVAVMTGAPAVAIVGGLYSAISTVAGMAGGYKVMGGQLYGDMTKVGVPHRVASTYSDIFGILMAAVEAAQIDQVIGAAPWLKEAVVKSVVEASTKMMLTRIPFDTAKVIGEATFKGALVAGLANAAEEGLQKMGDNLAKQLAYDISRNTGYDIKEKSPGLFDLVLENAVGGLVLGPLLDFPSSFMQITKTAKDGERIYRQAVIQAWNSKNRDDFLFNMNRLVGDARPETLSLEDWNQTLLLTYDGIKLHGTDKPFTMAYGNGQTLTLLPDSPTLYGTAHGPAADSPVIDTSGFERSEVDPTNFTSIYKNRNTIRIEIAREVEKSDENMNGLQHIIAADFIINDQGGIIALKDIKGWQTLRDTPDIQQRLESLMKELGTQFPGYSIKSLIKSEELDTYLSVVGQWSKDGELNPFYDPENKRTFFPRKTYAADGPTGASAARMEFNSFMADPEVERLTGELEKNMVTGVSDKKQGATIFMSLAQSMLKSSGLGSNVLPLIVKNFTDEKIRNAYGFYRNATKEIGLNPDVGADFGTLVHEFLHAWTGFLYDATNPVTSKVMKLTPAENAIVTKEWEELKAAFSPTASLHPTLEFKNTVQYRPGYLFNTKNMHEAISYAVNAFILDGRSTPENRGILRKITQFIVDGMKTLILAAKVSLKQLAYFNRLFSSPWLKEYGKQFLIPENVINPEDIDLSITSARDVMERSDGILRARNEELYGILTGFRLDDKGNVTYQPTDANIKTGVVPTGTMTSIDGIVQNSRLLKIMPELGMLNVTVRSGTENRVDYFPLNSVVPGAETFIITVADNGKLPELVTEAMRKYAFDSHNLVLPVDKAAESLIATYRVYANQLDFGVPDVEKIRPEVDKVLESVRERYEAANKAWMDAHPGKMPRIGEEIDVEVLKNERQTLEGYLTRLGRYMAAQGIIVDSVFSTTQSGNHGGPNYDGTSAFIQTHLERARWIGARQNIDLAAYDETPFDSIPAYSFVYKEDSGPVRPFSKYFNWADYVPPWAHRMRASKKPIDIVTYGGKNNTIINDAALDEVDAPDDIMLDGQNEPDLPDIDPDKVLFYKSELVLKEALDKVINQRRKENKKREAEGQPPLGGEVNLGTIAGDNVIKMLRDGGVKKEEIEWLGLYTFLKGKTVTGKPIAPGDGTKVSWDELRRHIQRNKLNIDDVTEIEDYDRTKEQALRDEMYDAEEKLKIAVKNAEKKFQEYRDFMDTVISMMSPSEMKVKLASIISYRSPSLFADRASFVGEYDSRDYVVDKSLMFMLDEHFGVLSKGAARDVFTYFEVDKAFAGSQFKFDDFISEFEDYYEKIGEVAGIVYDAAVVRREVTAELEAEQRRNRPADFSDMQYTGKSSDYSVKVLTLNPAEYFDRTGVIPDFMADLASKYATEEQIKEINQKIYDVTGKLRWRSDRLQEILANWGDVYGRVFDQGLLEKMTPDERGLYDKYREYASEKRWFYKPSNRDIHTLNRVSENIFLHVRSDVRQTSTGEMMLFIEEAQSDVHQKGYEKGYIKSNLPLDYITGPDSDGNYHVMGIDSNFDSFKGAVNAAHRLFDRSNTPYDMPFKSTFGELAIKRMLIEAINRGLDYLAIPDYRMVPVIEGWQKDADAILSLASIDKAEGEFRAAAQGRKRIRADKTQDERLAAVLNYYKDAVPSDLATVAKMAGGEVVDVKAVDWGDVSAKAIKITPEVIERVSSATGLPLFEKTITGNKKIFELRQQLEREARQYRTWKEFYEEYEVNGKDNLYQELTGSLDAASREDFYRRIWEMAKGLNSSADNILRQKLKEGTNLDTFLKKLWDAAVGGKNNDVKNILGKSGGTIYRFIDLAHNGQQYSRSAILAHMMKNADLYEIAYGKLMNDKTMQAVARAREAEVGKFRKPEIYDQNLDISSKQRIIDAVRDDVLVQKIKEGLATYSDIHSYVDRTKKVNDKLKEEVAKLSEAYLDARNELAAARAQAKKDESAINRLTSKVANLAADLQKMKDRYAKDMTDLRYLMKYQKTVGDFEKWFAKLSLNRGSVRYTKILELLKKAMSSADVNAVDYIRQMIIDRDEAALALESMGILSESILRLVEEKRWPRTAGKRPVMNLFEVEMIRKAFRALYETAKKDHSDRKKAIEAFYDKTRREMRLALDAHAKSPESIRGNVDYRKHEEKMGLKHPFAYAMENMRRFSRMLDGGKDGYFVNLLVEMERDRLRAQHREQTSRMKAILEWGKAKGIDPQEWVFTQVEIARPGQKSITFTKSDLGAFYLALANQKSRDAVIYGNMMDRTGPLGRESLSEEKIVKVGNAIEENVKKAMEEHLSETDREFLDKISYDFAQNFARFREVYEFWENRGVDIEANFFPMYRIGASIETGMTSAEAEILARNGFEPSVDKGRGISRKKISPAHQSPIDTNLMAVWQNSINDLEHYIAYADYINLLNNTIGKKAKNDTLRTRIESEFGRRALDYIDGYIEEVARPDSNNSIKTGAEFLRMMRGNVYVATLGLRFPPAILQAITTPAVNFAYAPVDTFVNILKLLNPLEWVDRAKGSEFAKSKSAIIANRQYDQVLAMIESMPPDKFTLAQKKMAKFALGGLTKIDEKMVCACWNSLYAKKTRDLAKGGPITPEIELDAIKWADDVILMTQPSARGVDVAPFFRNRNEAMQILTQFGFSLSTVFQNIYYDVPAAVRAKKTWQAVGIVVSYMAAASALAFVRGERPDEDDEDIDKVRWWIAKSLGQATDSFPVIGTELTHALMRTLGGDERESLWNGSPFPVVDGFVRAIDKATKKDALQTGEDWWKMGKDLLTATGYAFGVPVRLIGDLESIGKMVNEEGDSVPLAAVKTALGQKPEDK